MVCIVFTFCVAAVIASPAQTLSTLYSFCSQANCADGEYPLGRLVQGTDGNFYGTTFQQGAAGGGTVYKLTPSGALTTLHSFAGYSDGAQPYAGLIQATDGNFYGVTTIDGGVGQDVGTVFKITSGGTFTSLHAFAGYPADGGNPWPPLLQASDGNFYGTTYEGGAPNVGIVFKITAAGSLTIVHTFCTQSGCPDGANPQAGLVQGSDGNLYGTAVGGGTNGEGTVFKITTSGTLTTLHSFAITDGAAPSGTLVQASDGNFYGTTYEGGASNNGTVFAMTPGGTLTTLYSFCSQSGCADGSSPQGGLVQDTDGTFYGTTYHGGADSIGTIFSLSVGLGPFVKTLPASGKAGATVIILGTNLTGATKVSFNGIAAKFTVVSSTEITTTVPTGATTGSVTVVTPSGTLKNNVIFNVAPQIKSFTPTSGPVGTTVTITGVSLKQTTEVTFDGVAATAFTVDSATKVTVMVPAGANTGTIAITTPGGTATSTASFTVTE